VYLFNYCYACIEEVKHFALL